MTKIFLDENESIILKFKKKKKKPRLYHRRVFGIITKEHKSDNIWGASSYRLQITTIITATEFEDTEVKIRGYKDQFEDTDTKIKG